MMNFWITIFALVVAVLVMSRAHLLVEKRCQSICQLSQLDEQCKMCNNRSPVRFGKRSKEFHMTQWNASPMDSRRLKSLGSLARLILDRVRLGYIVPDK